MVKLNMWILRLNFTDDRVDGDSFRGWTGNTEGNQSVDQ